MSPEEAGKWLHILHENPLTAVAVLWIALQVSRFGRQLIARFNRLEEQLDHLVQLHEASIDPATALAAKRPGGRRSYDPPPTDG